MTATHQCPYPQVEDIMAVGYDLPSAIAICAEIMNNPYEPAEYWWKLLRGSHTLH